MSVDVSQVNYSDSDSDSGSSIVSTVYRKNTALVDLVTREI